MKTRQIVLASRPIGVPTKDNFRFESIELPQIKEGEVMLQGLYYSVDPYMRGRMNDAKSYAPPFQLNEPLTGGVIARVTETKSDSFTTGDYVLGSLPWRENCVANQKDIHQIDATIAPASYYLGVLGMTGLTAYIGLMHIGKPKSGETVVVSGAAGAVGIVVGQIAKIQGCRVIGIAGSDKKTKMLTEEFGFDQAINYKTTPDIEKAIIEACPDGVDIYFDNVGGTISDAVISQMNLHSRIPLCGQIALYNDTANSSGPRVQPILLTKSILMQGFIVSNYQNLFPDAIQHLSQWVKEGKLKFKETIMHGFEQLPDALLGLFSGENIGKMVVSAVEGDQVIKKVSFEKDAEVHYDTVSTAISKLRKQGFTIDFNLKDNSLTHPEGVLKAGDFTIVDVYRYEGNSDPADEAVVYAIESKDGIKGILVTGYGISSDPASEDILKNLSIRE
ncbi:NADP-dependent oxidoreductase [Dyadobacter frigoris]|uniref:NADP-dependent oxidoreductase n=1 Tax=Dyadobacter frigoris TaxID=2576211 RepID=A0A4U6CU28_9BACT|nr:NADP-dependent oxidoreductase [Dyadobacter frigoris]TKT86518.1 NADP-dependent oxidoreductase [Dyadobacter frigoris]